MRGIVSTDEFKASDYENADIILCAALYSDIHASFKDFVRVHVPDIEAQIRGKIVLITPATRLSELADDAAPINTSTEYAARLKVAEKDFPCLAFFAGLEGSNAIAFPLEYRKQPDDYIKDFYQIVMTAVEVRAGRGLEGEVDPNVIVHRRGEVLDELGRLNDLGRFATKGKNVVASSTIANLISFARFIGWVITRS